MLYIIIYLYIFYFLFFYHCPLCVSKWEQMILSMCWMSWSSALARLLLRWQLGRSSVCLAGPGSAVDGFQPLELWGCYRTVSVRMDPLWVLKLCVDPWGVRVQPLKVWALKLCVDPWGVRVQPLMVWALKLWALKLWALKVWVLKLWAVLRPGL